MDINLDRVLGRLEELYQCGAQEDGTFTRMAYSPEDRKGREDVYKRQVQIRGIRRIQGVHVTGA